MTLKSISPVNEDGMVDVSFILNGMPRIVTVKSKAVAKAAAASGKASSAKPKADKVCTGLSVLKHDCD